MLHRMQMTVGRTREVRGGMIAQRPIYVPLSVLLERIFPPRIIQVLLVVLHMSIAWSFLSFPAVARAQTPSPVAAYAFNETSGTTAVDASGNGNNGVLTNGPLWVAGKNGNGVQLDGGNDYVNLQNPTSLRLTGSMTLSAWIKPGAFPSDDAAIISKRASGPSLGFQLDTTVDNGPRTIGFKLTSATGATMARYGATALQVNQWYHVSGVYDAAARTLQVYLNGVVDNGALVGTVTGTQQNSALPVKLGQRAGAAGYAFNGTLDDVRIYSAALTPAQLQTVMTTPVSQSLNVASNSSISTLSTSVTNMATVVDRGDVNTINNTASDPTTSSFGFFLNEVLISGMTLPTAVKFLPDGSMLVLELGGHIWKVNTSTWQLNPTPFLVLTNVGSENSQQGLLDLVLDPDFVTNHHYYVFYTSGTPSRDRVSRFTANADLSGTIEGSEFVLYQDPQDASTERHGGALTFGNDGKLYITTGDHFNPPDAQSLTNPRGKILRLNKDGSAPMDNPFYDGSGPNVDAIWALGLHNPFRASYDLATGRLYIGDVGDNDSSTAREEVNVGAAGANYGWEDCEGFSCSTNPLYTSPLYAYGHHSASGMQNAAITGGFVYRGNQFPAEYYGSYFFADYAQGWIKRLNLDPVDGHVTGVFNFAPLNGTSDGQSGDIVHLCEGPDGALYYVDLGYSITGHIGVGEIRRIRFVSDN